MTAAMDTGKVDWLAVEFVCNGTPMRLGNDTATLEAAILAIGYGLPCQATADRLGTNTRRISRVLEKSGAVTCAFCKRYAICPDGILPHHVLGSGVRCGMSGHRYDDKVRAETIRSDQRKVVSLG